MPGLYTAEEWARIQERKRWNAAQQLLNRKRKKGKGNNWHRSMKPIRDASGATPIGTAGLAELPESKWTDRNNPPWFGESQWPDFIPQDLLDPRNNL